MVRSFVLSLWFWIALIPGTLVALCIVLSCITRFRNPPTIEVCHYFRGADIKRMFVKVVLDEIRGVPTRKFMKNRRLMLHEARKFMLAVIHDMGILIAWCDGAVYRELVEKPWEAHDDDDADDDEDELHLVMKPAEAEVDTEESAKDSIEFVEAHRRLAAAAREFRRFALKNLVTINLALLFGTHWRARWLAPLFAERHWKRLIAVYGQVFKEVVETGSLYDDELPEALLKSLFKIRDPEGEIAMWREGLLPH